MTIELIALKLKARSNLQSWYRHNIYNKAGIDHLLHNELRFIMDNPTRSLTRRWFMKRFPKMLGYF
jgi:hypothetical protein